ncbi:hypothetical protein [Archangium lansingense]|uniref:AAA domain-containing protein n=1 Tax=Archangium lansingense TaxID=2995310 RepID=A0ABT4AN65_9BACT|nr:hypothetical protein [Archangium lansinium]MCY1083021.1 hypothetical protein [Archangium lansinium]
MLEPDVERQLEESVSTQTREALKKSLFERLFHSLRERTRLDGFPRVVTLDTQYRMHPVLGDFVSRVFTSTMRIPASTPGGRRRNSPTGCATTETPWPPSSPCRETRAPSVEVRASRVRRRRAG